MRSVEPAFPCLRDKVRSKYLCFLRVAKKLQEEGPSLTSFLLSTGAPSAAHSPRL